MGTETQDLDDDTTLAGFAVDTAAPTASLARADLEDARKLELLLRSDEPTRLGHYVLLDKLGEGGMGVVFAAYDERLDRKVALKLLHARGGSDAHSRLVREAQALARLSHPNVVQIYEIAERDGLDFLVMEFIEGETLGRWRAHHEPDRAQLLRVFAAAGRGLAAAHDKDLVHRDFKPDNVMICADGRVVVMDFGLAREHTASDTQLPLNSLPATARTGRLDTSGLSELSTELTRTGALMGTPAYMSPEQFRGEPSDANTDQWSFCVALWEALHGSRPFVAENLGALTLAVIEGQREAPSGDVPSWLQQIIERGLAPEPHARWPSMSVLLTALKADPTVQRRKWALAGAALGVLVSAAVGTQLWATQREAQIRQTCATEAGELHELWSDNKRSELRERFAGAALAGPWEQASGWLDRYADRWQAARAHSCLATRLEDQRDPALHAQVEACLDEGSLALAALLDVWDSAEDRVVAHAALAAAGLPPIAACEDRSWLAQRVEAPADPEARAKIARVRAGLERARAESSTAAFELALARSKAALREAEALGWDPLRAEALYAVAESEAELSLFEDARAHYEQAHLRATATAHDLVALRAAVGLTATVGYMMSNKARGLEWAGQAAALLERTGLAGSVEDAQYQEALGNLHWSAGDFDSSMQAFETARAIYASALGPAHPSTAKQLENLAYLHMERANYERALEQFNASRALLETSLGADHPHVGVAWTYYGDALRRKGDTAEAAAAHERSLALLEASLGPTHSQLSDVLNNLGMAYSELDRSQDALATYERARHINELAFGPMHGQLGTTVNNIAIIYMEAGDYAAARPNYERALAIAEHNHGPEHPRVGIGHHNLGKLEEALEHHALAAEHFERARAIFSVSFGATHPNTLNTSLALARALHLSGELQRARLLYEEVLPHSPEQAAKLRIKASFGLGRLLFELGETQRAMALVHEAREILLKLGVAGEDGLVPIDAWLAEHE